MKVVLVPCAETEWRQEERVLGRVELPPAAEAEKQCSAWVQVLRDAGVQHIFHAPDDLAKMTAKWLGRQLVIPTRAIEGLAEPDAGLWAGLTEQQLKSRFASAHRELRESPLHVSPPAGENLGDAAERLSGALRKLLKRNSDVVLAVVLRPLGLAMARYALEGHEPNGGLWEAARSVRAPVVIDRPLESGAGYE